MKDTILRSVLAALACTAALAIVGPSMAANVNLKADLKASSEVPPNTSKGHGELQAKLDTSTKLLSWNVTYDDLTGPATAAHFHGPAPVGQHAGPTIPIAKTALASPITGSQTLTDPQVQDLMGGKWYFNVHTAKNPSGEIRGQVMPAN